MWIYRYLFIWTSINYNNEKYYIMEPTSEFLPAQQCFIVYDEFTKKVAISLRNRLSEREVRCTIWNEKQFRDNEARLSNFNRLLILSEKVSAEYLAAPTNVKQTLTDYSYYVREGRVASITLRDDIDYAGILETANQTMASIMKALKDCFRKKKKNEDIAAEDVAQALDQLQKAQMLALPMPNEDMKRTDDETTSKKDRIREIAATIAGGVIGGVAGAVAWQGVLPSMLALYGYSWYESRKNLKDIKLAFYFTAARQFELQYFDDFVNAK